MSRFRTLASAESARLSGRWLATCLALFVLVALGFPGRARAAEGASSAPAKATAKADTSQPVMFLKQTVVTGARYPRQYYESPQALSFLSRKDLAEERPTVVGDALYGVPGTDNSKDSPWEQRPVLRGLGGQRVLVMMDGDAINSARGNGPHPSLVDATQIDRVEVVRGPSSVAYGSDALGGAINIITRQAPVPTGGNSMRGSASIGASSADQQFNGDVQLMPQIGKFSAFLSGGGKNTEDFQTPDNGKVQNSSFSDYNGIANVRYQMSERTAIKAGWQMYRGNNIGLPGLDVEIPGVFSQTFNFPYYNRDAASLTVEHTYDQQSWFENSSARGYWQREQRDFYSNIDVPGLYTTATDRYLKLDTYGLHAQANSRKFDRYRMSFGFDIARDKTAGTNVAASSNTPGNVTPDTSFTQLGASLPTGDFDSYAGFVQSDIFLHPQWTLSLGARYTYYHYSTDFGVSQPAFAGILPPPGLPPGFPPPFPAVPEVDFPSYKVDNHALAGSAGLVYAIKPDLHVSANVANGYRQPNAQDLFFYGPADVGTVVGNQSLKPEKCVSTDLGLRWGPGDLALSGNLFYSTYDDLIDAVQIPAATPTYQYVNITKARIWGGEAEGEWRFMRQWDFRANMTGAIGDITSAEAIQQLYGVSQSTAPLGGVPPFKGNASIRWTSSNGILWIEPSTAFSWRTNRLPLPTPGVPVITAFKKEWIIGNIAAGIDLGHGQHLVLGVRNFTNLAYQLALASLEQPGVSFYGSLTSNF